MPRAGHRKTTWQSTPGLVADTSTGVTFPRRRISAACRMVWHISRNPSPNFPGQQPMPRRNSRLWRRGPIRQSLTLRMSSKGRSESHATHFALFSCRFRTFRQRRHASLPTVLPMRWHRGGVAGGGSSQQDRGAPGSLTGRGDHACVAILRAGTRASLHRRPAPSHPAQYRPMLQCMHWWTAHGPRPDRLRRQPS
jgi:hypothetical protein